MVTVDPGGVLTKICHGLFGCFCMELKLASTLNLYDRVCVVTCETQ